MKEQLYTIPLNDAVNAQDECPFCFIHRSIEQDLLDFVLGSGSSYMEADIREQTDKAGFCRYHFQKMFDYGNTLGNAWILKTHYQRMIREMQQEFASFRPGKSSLLGKFKKAEGSENTIGMWIRAKEDSCYICSQYKDTYERYLDTFFYLWKNDESFRNKIFTIPLPQILQITTSAIATTAISQSAEQLLIADWDRVRPMAMMMGPVTMGGKKRITLPVPKILINRDNTRYSRPEQATPKQA